MVDQMQFRSSMARLAAAVTIVTTEGPAGRNGMVASTVCSISDDPPTLLVCVNRTARMNSLVKANGVLCVNILSAEQETVARHFFATDAAGERFRSTERWEAMVTGAPAVGDALVSLDCDISQAVEVCTHTIFIAAVRDIRLGPCSDALLYFERGYRRLNHPSGESPAASTATFAS